MPVSQPFARLSLGLLTLVCAAQQPAPPKAPPETVSFDVVVRNSKGLPVRTLTTADLEVTDSGTPVAVKSLTLAKPEANDPANPRLISFVFDNVISEKNRVARQAAEDITTAAAPGTWFSVLHVGAKLAVIQPYTQDREKVQDAIRRVTARDNQWTSGKKQPGIMALVDTGEPRNTASPSAQLERLAFRTAAAAETLMSEEDSKATLVSLLALARTQGEARGQKAAVLFSAGMQLTTRLRALVTETVATANRANLSFYILDLTYIGPETWHNNLAYYGAPAQMAAPGDDPTNGPNDLVIRSNALSSRRDDQALMNDLARGTGGFYAVHPTSLRKPARRMVENFETGYHLTFDSAARTFDGKMRPVAVRVKDRKLRVQAPSGYVALPPGASADTKPFEIPMLSAIAADPMPQDVLFRPRALRMGSDVTVVIEVPLRDRLGAEELANQVVSAHFSVLAVVRDAQGKLLHKFSQDVPYRTAREKLERARTEVFTFERHFAAQPGDYSVEYAVLDANSRQAGAWRSPLHVETPSSAPMVSDISLVRAIEPLPAERREVERLQYLGSRVVPDLTDTFVAKTAPMRFFFTATGHQPGPVAVEVEVSRNGDPFARAALTKDQAAWLFTMPTEKLARGNYAIVARAAQNGSTSEQRAVFRVESDVTAAGPATLELAGGGALKPSDAEQQQLVTILRDRAMDETRRLPNFSCMLATHRWFDPAGSEEWRPKNSYIELVEVTEKEERHKLLEVDGVAAQHPRPGMRSEGEFGAHLRMALDPKYHATVEWSEWTMLGTRLLHVFRFQVEPRYSELRLLGEAARPGVKSPGYHGLLYVEPDTLAVRRLTLIADNPAATSDYDEMSLTVDCDYVALGDRDFLMPVTAELKTRMTKRAAYRNQLEFRDYRRFGSKSSLTFDEPK